MLGNTYRLPLRLLGIPIHLDISFLIMLPVLAWLIGSDVGVYVQWFDLPIESGRLERGILPYLLGFLAAVGLFTSVLIHELGHSIVGRAYGLRVRNITLWILGGMAQFEKLPRRAGTEAVIAIAGPVTSYLLGGLCWLGLRASSEQAAASQFLLAYLTTMNFILATFNLLPALPLDGGRILRSLLALRLSHLKATQVSASISKSLAFLLGLVGFMSLNIFLVLIAFFVYMAVTAETRHATLSELLHGIKVKDLMAREVKTVPWNFQVSELIQKMLQDRHLGYPVLDDKGQVLGLVTLQDVQRHRKSGGADDAPIHSVLSTDMVTIWDSSSALTAFEKMSQNNFQRLVVLDALGNLVGIISKTDLIRAIQVRMMGTTSEAEDLLSQRRG